MYFSDFIVRNVHHSNAIEGSTLGYFETFSILFNPQEYIGSHTVREIYEAVNLKSAYDYVFKTIDKPLTLDYVKKLGVLINNNILNLTDFRECNVIIKGSQHIPPDYNSVKRLLSQLLYMYNNTSISDIDTALAQFHLDFEHIHPFQDGNGRTGRLLVAREYLKRDLLPPIIGVSDRFLYRSFLESNNVVGLAELFHNMRSVEKARASQFI